VTGKKLGGKSNGSEIRENINTGVVGAGIHLVKDTNNQNPRFTILPNMILEVYPMKTQKSFFEQNGGTYTQVGNVLIPNLTIGEDGQQPIGKYGRMRKRYLKEHE